MFYMVGVVFQLLELRGVLLLGDATRDSPCCRGSPFLHFVVILDFSSFLDLFLILIPTLSPSFRGVVFGVAVVLHAAAHFETTSTTQPNKEPTDCMTRQTTT
jgi:hypothetical protein